MASRDHRTSERAQPTPAEQHPSDYSSHPPALTRYVESILSVRFVT